MAIYFNNLTTDLFALITIIGVSVYVYIRFYLYTYWERRGVKSLKPTFPIGNFGAAFMQKQNIGIMFHDIYKSTNEPYLGIYSPAKASLLVNDPELVRTIFIKDFQHFHDRGVYSDEKRDPLSGNLFSLPGEKWKHLRTKLSPTFTSGKLKAMFSTLVDCGESLTKYLDGVAAIEDTIEMRELLAQYTTNIISSVAFGIDVDCIKDPQNTFRKYGRQAFAPTLKNSLRGLISFVFPKLMSLLKLKSVDQEIEDFMISVVKQTLQHREQNNVTKKDFFQLMVQIRNTGIVQNDDDWVTKITDDESLKKLSIPEMAAQAFVFFLAGFETSSTVMSFTLYELARNAECQRKVQQEIDEVLAKYDGKITYDSVMEMKYLESCIDESLRLYPPVPMLNRECAMDWTIPKTNVVIEKGTPIVIPAYALQHDAKYFPNPEQFIPERFSAENTAGKSFVDMPYMPFGEGPRICIGLRMGKMQSKVGLVLMLKNNSYHLSKNTIKPLELDPKSIILAPIGGLNLKVTKRV